METRTRFVFLMICGAVTTLNAKEYAGDNLLDLENRIKAYIHNIQKDEDLLEPRVIGGTEYEEGKWPWLVSIQGKVPERMLFGIPLTYRMYYCGASLLNDEWLLTAAHCFGGDKADDPQYWNARLGDIDLDSNVREKVKGWVGDLLDKDAWKDWYISADKIVIHPDYDPTDLWFSDIALVHLSEDVPSGSETLPHIQKVTLPISDNSSFPFDGQECVMKGWGCTEGGGPVSDVAMEAPLPKVSDKECYRYWGVPAKSRLCAGYNLEGMGICPGDSGGPLTCQNEKGDWVQTGIASFTSGNKPGNVPGAFTRVSYFVSWINNIINEPI